MTLLSIGGLVLAMFLLAIIPGPGVWATVSKALTSGFRQTLPVITGIVVGDLLFLLFAIYGLSMIATTFSALFVLSKYLGGFYLIWLGISLWRDPASQGSQTTPIPPAATQGFLGGLSITLGNPKVILFYLGFLPTFVDLEMLSTLDIVIVMLVVSVVLGSVMLLYAYTASKSSLLFRSKSAQSYMRKTAGSVMIATGTVLLFRG